MLYRSEKHFGLGLYIHYYHMALIPPMENLSTPMTTLPFLPISPLQIPPVQIHPSPPQTLTLHHNNVYFTPCHLSTASLHTAYDIYNVPPQHTTSYSLNISRDLTRPALTICAVFTKFVTFSYFGFYNKNKYLTHIWDNREKVI